MAETRAIRRAARWSIPAVVVLALIVWFALHAASASGAEADRYATATVTRGTVTETYTGSGTVDKVDQASTTFPVSAKVTSVHVAVGDKVKAGEPLATIDDVDLRVAVIEARQTEAEAEAEASLEQAQDAAAATATSSATPSATVAPSGATTRKAATTPKSAPSTPASRPSSRPSTRPSEPSGGGSHPAVDLEKLNQDVRTARAQLATLQATATTALAAQQRTCAPVLGTTPTPSKTSTPRETPTPSQTATPSATATPSPTGTPSATSTAPSPADGEALALCVAALQATGQGQQQVATQQTRVDQAVDALVRAATTRTTTPTPSQSVPTASAQPTRTSSNPTNSPTASARSSKTGAATISGTENSAGQRSGQSTLTVGAAEAAVTKAKIALAAAKAKLGAATMTAPITGTVAEMPFAAGDNAGTDDAVVILGGGDVQIQMAVSEAAFNTLKIGQRATITTPGGGRAVGTVSARGLLPTESTSGSSSSTTFPVTVTASGRAAQSLPAGASGSVSVSLKSSPDAIVVPVSAVTRSGSVGVVQVLKDGTATRTTVKIGAVGGSTVEILEGLSPGDTLVLADNTTALPTNSSNRGLRAGGGGPPGGATQVGGGATGGR